MDILGGIGSKHFDLLTPRQLGSAAYSGVVSMLVFVGRAFTLMCWGWASSPPLLACPALLRSRPERRRHSPPTPSLLPPWMAFLAHYIRALPPPPG